MIVKNVVINYSARGIARVAFKAGVSYGDDLKKVEKIALQTINGLPFLIKGKPVQFFYEELAGSSINFMARFWVRYNSNADIRKAKSEAIKAIKTAFDANDIMLPFPTTTVDFGVKGGVPLSEVPIRIFEPELVEER